MKILFISRAFPPVTGGIENHNHALSVWLPKFATVKTLANYYGKKFLPIFFPYVTARILLTLHRYDVLLLGDGVLGVVGYVVKFFYPKKIIVSVVHGLDLTYPNACYQRFWLGIFLPRLDGFIAVSRETKTQATEKGLHSQNIAVIPNGIDQSTLSSSGSRADLATLLNDSLKDTKVLLTTGRLVKRKGAEWFIRNVLGQLPKDTLYILAGAGPQEPAIRRALEETGLASQVRLLGRVTDKERNLLLHTADLFIQPNIHVMGDMEGFGIAAIEAAASGLPVVAARLEGLIDAITDRENGILVTPENAAEFCQTINALLTNDAARLALGARAERYTREHFHWNVIAERYVATLKTVTKS